MAEIDQAQVPKEGETNYKLGDEIPERYIDKATAELKSGCRIVLISKDGSSFKIRIENPTIEQELLLNDAYTQEYNKLMQADGYMTRKEIENQLVKRGVIDKLSKTKQEKLQKSLNQVLEDFNLMLVEDKTSDIVLDKKKKEYYVLRDKLFEISSENTEHFVNAIESICDQKQMFVKMVMCVKDSEGNPVWKNSMELMKTNDRVFMSQLIQECQIFWSGISREVLVDLPGVLLDIHRGGSSENLQGDNGESTSQ